MNSVKSYFQSKKKHKLTAIGYWHSIFEPEYPDPAKFIDLQWNVAEKITVIEHISQARVIADWTGQSWCRFRCGEMQLGSQDVTDGIYIFPEGLVHYLQHHHVRLPEEFIRHVRHYQPVEINFGLEQCEIHYDWWISQKGWNSSLESFTAPNDELIESYKRLTQAKGK
jgi:hypothetical protein